MVRCCCNSITIKDLGDKMKTKSKYKIFIDTKKKILQYNNIIYKLIERI